MDGQAMDAALVVADRDWGSILDGIGAGDRGVVLVTDPAAVGAGLLPVPAHSFQDADLDRSPFDPRAVRAKLEQFRSHHGAGVTLVVDMAWGWITPAASANFDVWGSLCSDLANAGGRIVSVYDWRMLIGDQLLSALRSHRQFLSASGARENPFWLPNEYLRTGSVRQQVSFLLGRAVPDWADLTLPATAEDSAARGAVPSWLGDREPGPMQGLDTRWKIRCLGRLRIYTSASNQVTWAIPGAAPKKTKALFAYLLLSGEAGAPLERLGDLLWPDETDETRIRARVHHAVSMLRKTLGGKAHVERRGDFYHISLPPGTWIDLRAFEQFCRRAKSLETAGQHEAALQMLAAAERLYSGDLFEDLAADHVEREIDNWCLPRRSWLKQMALKVQRDKASLLRRRGELREATKACQKAFEMDPACEIAHEEQMRVFHAQGRRDALGRQYRQYLDALDQIGADTRHPSLRPLFESLSSGI